MTSGTCEHCGASFRCRLIHNGFNETGYAYCARCGGGVIASIPEWRRVLQPLLDAEPREARRAAQRSRR